jgi:two-component sensor histidine kinase
MRFVAVVFCFFLCQSYFSQSKFDNATNYLVNGDLDSAYTVLKEIKNQQEAELFASVLFNFASYGNYSDFLNTTTLTNKKTIQKIFNFVERRVKDPKSKKKVNMDYVILMNNLIFLLANDLEVRDASIYFNKLQKYLGKIKKRDKDFERAELYLYEFEALLGTIETDVKKLDLGFKRMNRAFELGDTVLYMKYANWVCNKFISTDDLIGYNNFMFDVYRNSINSKKSIHFAYVVDKLLNGLIFAKYEDNKFLEDRMFELYNDQKFKPKSYYIFLFYFYIYLDADIVRIKPLVQQMGYPDLKALNNHLQNAVLPNLKNDDYTSLLIGLSRLFNKLNENDLAMDLMYQAIQGSEKSYSRDLAETLADYKTKDIKNEKERIIEKEREKRDLYLKSGIFNFILFVLTGILALALLRRKNILKVRNSENEILVREKDLLIQEIHHRVKNNFELVSALLELQSSETESEEAKKKLFEGQARIQSLSLLHNKLYESNHSTEVNMYQYISELAALILKSADLSDKVKLQIQANDIQLDIDTTTPLGLIINELITNSCKHAFKGEGRWELHIALTRHHDDYLISYSEFGIQNNNELKLENKKGLGMMLIKNLVKQLHGNLETTYNEGTKVKLWFSDKVKRKKVE